MNNVNWKRFDEQKNNKSEWTCLGEVSPSKIKIMLDTVFESFIKLHGKSLISEDTTSDKILSRAKNNGKEYSKNKDHDFFSKRGEWQEFEKHVEIITQFMGTNENEKLQMMDAIKRTFVALAGEVSGNDSDSTTTDVLNKGLEKLGELDTLFADAGIKGLDPAIRASKFLDLLSPFYKTQQPFKVDDPDKPGKKKTIKRTVEKPMDKQYSVTQFIEMLDERKNRMLSPLIKGKTAFKLGQVLKNAFADDGDMHEQMEIFRKIVNQGGYSKNNAQVGKGEIALAMFFGDCSLPDDKGDINLSGKAIEIKGNDAGITWRTTIYKPLLNMTFQQARQLIEGQGDSLSVDLFKPYVSGKNKIDPESMSPSDMYDQIKTWAEDLGIEETYKSISDKFDNVNGNDIASEGRRKKEEDNEPQKSKEHGILFCLVFGMLARAYFKSFDSMLIINTLDDISKDVGDSSLLNSNVLRLTKKNKDWLVDGINFLTTLDKYGLSVAYLNRSNEGTFKAKFK